MNRLKRDKAKIEASLFLRSYKINSSQKQLEPPVDTA